MNRILIIAIAGLCFSGGGLRLALTAGETFWLRLYAKGAE